MKLKQLGANSTQVELSSDLIVLFSYQTPVACHVQGEGYYRTAQHHSRTTSKHISQWLRAMGAREASERPQSFFDQLAGGNRS